MYAATYRAGIAVHTSNMQHQDEGTAGGNNLQEQHAAVIYRNSIRQQHLAIDILQQSLQGSIQRRTTLLDLQSRQLRCAVKLSSAAFWCKVLVC